MLSSGLFVWFYEPYESIQAKSAFTKLILSGLSDVQAHCLFMEN